LNATNIPRWLIALGLPFWLAGWAVADEPRASESVIYVATTGNDAWTGQLPETNAAKTDGPLATLQRARAQMRELGPGRTRTVVVRGGSYFLDETFHLDKEDSGTAEHPILWRAEPGEEVRLVNGRPLGSDAFQPVTDAEALQRLSPAAQTHVVQADLTACKIPRGETFPAIFRGPAPAAGLFLNDQRMTLTRWPNDGWATIAKIIEMGSRPGTGDASGHLGVFEYSGKRPERWKVADGVWLHGYWCFDWYDQVIQVKTINPAQHRITLAQPHAYGLQQGNPAPRRFCAINVLEELDQPGEYYIDRATNRLYFWPPTSLEGARIVMAARDAPAVALKNVSYVVLRGFIVEDSHGDGLLIDGGTADHIEACIVRNIRMMGIRINGGQSHRVEACDIHDTGAGGLLLTGGDRKTLTPGRHAAINNHIWRFSQLQLTAAYAIELAGVGSVAAHNLIHDAPHQAIYVRGNDHVFEYNVVHHICAESDDCGAYYKGRNPSCRGNVIRYNFWHHIGSPLGHGNCAIYFDDGDGGDTVFGNVFFRCGEPGQAGFGAVFSHGGYDLAAENNIFIECRRALGSVPWSDQAWKKLLDGWEPFLRKEVDISKPPYITRYPDLAGLVNFQPGQQPRINRATQNLVVMCDTLDGGNWQTPLDKNWVTDHDPGFMDAAEGDFRLRPNAEVFAHLPAFRPIPFEQIGLRADELRRDPVREAWPREPLTPLPPPKKRKK
jgi:hypothetical protein